jgi:hypothetical protein
MQNLFDRVCKHLDIDSKLKLKIPPGKLSLPNLQFPRPELVYFPDLGKVISLHPKRHGFITILHDVEYKDQDDGLYIFGPIYGSWTYEYQFDDGRNFMYPLSSPWLSELKVKIVLRQDESQDTTSAS